MRLIMVNLKRYSWGAKLGAFMVIVGLVFLLIPVSSVVGEHPTFPPDAEEGESHIKIDSQTPSYTVPEGCVITAVEIHAGLGTITSGRIISNGNYGHIIERTASQGQGQGQFNYMLYYVKSDATVPDGQEYIDGYTVSGIGTISASVSKIGDGPVISNISWVRFYYNCDDDPDTGSITVAKALSGTLAEGVFTFGISKVGDPNWTYDGDPVEITYPGNTGNKVFNDLPFGTYQVTETSSTGTNVTFTTSVDPEDGQITLSDTNLTGTVSFTNTGDDDPDTGSILINKSFTDGASSSGTFTFGVFDDETDGNQVETASITITDDTSGSTTVSGLTLGQTYWVEELSGPGTNQVPGAGQRISVVAGDPPGDAGTAGFVNTPGTGSITVNKMLGASLSEAITNGLTGTPTFTFSINTDPEQTVTITGAGSAAFTDLIAGNTYTITETTTGYATSVSYTGAGWTTGTSISVDILEDENSSVYFLNDTVIEVPGSITVHKMIGDGIDADTEFNFSINTDPVQTATIVGAGTATFSNIAAGTYTITETTTGFVTSVSYDGFTWAGGSSIGAVVSDGSNTNVYFLNEEEDDDPVIEIAGISEPKIVTSEPIIEVLGLTELPYTGYRSWYYILGLLLILGGGLLIQLLRRRKKVEYFI